MPSLRNPQVPLLASRGVGAGTWNVREIAHGRRDNFLKKSEEGVIGSNKSWKGGFGLLF